MPCRRLDKIYILWYILYIEPIALHICLHFFVSSFYGSQPLDT